MPSITITEALAEIKTIGKRIEKKRQFIGQYLVRQEIVKDPLTNQGGSMAALKAEAQGIADLEERLVALRRGIAGVNASVFLVVCGETRTIGDWLTWRREVAPGRKAALVNLRQTLINFRTQQQAKGMTLRTEPSADPTDKDLIVNVDERALATDAEKIEEVLGTLDGLLSLKNATTTFDI